MEAIRYTFYTESDDFSYVQSVEGSRDWLRSRNLLQAVGEAPDGTRAPGAKLDDLDAASIGRWVAAASMGIVRRKADEGGYISFYTERRSEWVSVFAERIQAVGAEVQDDTGDDGDDTPPSGKPLWAMWTDEKIEFTD